MANVSHFGEFDSQMRAIYSRFRDNVLNNFFNIFIIMSIFIVKKHNSLIIIIYMNIFIIYNYMTTFSYMYATFATKYCYFFATF